jgi:hypothetical protein
MKIIINEHQLTLLSETYKRDRWDAEYADEYPKYRKLLISMLKQDVKSWGKAHGSTYLMNDKKEPLFAHRSGSKTLYYDYSLDKEIENSIPYHILSRHLKNAVYDYFNGLFPDLEIKEVSGANIG